MKSLFTLLYSLLYMPVLFGTTYMGNPGNYLSFLSQLIPGDTLMLAAGTYSSRLNLDDIVGTTNQPIVIMGPEGANSAIFVGNACCNTVSIERCAWLVIKNLTIDGQNIPFIDAVKAEGSSNNWAHHITLENLYITGHGATQSTVGINTKCPAWDWVIRRNRIEAAGTGIYLGNSNGEAPFVNGIVEYNLVTNTVGYNMQIKHQNVGTRNVAGITLNGKTTIRYNVFSKAENASSGSDARPNLLVGNFPASGDGSSDYYEIYGNFFWQNPYEGLFQGTGNIAFYNNVLVNHHPGGFGVAIFRHNNFSPRDIYIFSNTILTNTNGIDFSQPDLAYEQIVAGNAVFAANPILDSPQSYGNTTSTYANASSFVVNPSASLSLLDMSPLSGALQATVLDFSPFTNFQDYAVDFDGYWRNWTFRGAYTSVGVPVWDLALENRPDLGAECHTPANMNTAVNFPNGVIASWNPPAGSVGCQVFGGRVGGPQGSVIAMQPNASSFQVPHHFFQQGVPYQWRVRCACSINPYRLSAYSPFQTFTYGAPSYPVDDAVEEEATRDIFISNKEETSSLTLFPNPTSALIQVYFSDIEVEEYRIYDHLGRELLQDTPDHNLESLDLSDYPYGVYYLFVRTNEQVHRRVSFVKQ